MCCEAIVNDAAVPGDKGASVAGVSCESCCEGHGPSHGQGSEFGQVLVRLRRVGPFLLTSISIASCKSCSMYPRVVVRRRLSGLSVVLLGAARLYRKDGSSPGALGAADAGDAGDVDLLLVQVLASQPNKGFVTPPSFFSAEWSHENASPSGEPDTVPDSARSALRGSLRNVLIVGDRISYRLGLSTTQRDSQQLLQL